MNKHEYTSYRWIILLVTFLPVFTLAMCQFQVTPYAAEIMKNMGLSAQQYATIATAPMLTGVFLAFVSGTLADKFGVKNTVLVALIITTAAALLRSLVGSYVLLLFITMLMGVAGTVINSNNVKIMSSWFPPHQMGVAMGIVIGAANGGTVLAMLLGKGLSPDYRKAFLYGGGVFVVLTILWMLFMKEKTNEVHSDIDKPKSKIGDVLKSRNIWVASLGAALFMGVNMCVSALMAPGLVAKGVADGAANLAIMSFAIFAVIGSFIMPGVIAKQANTKTISAVLSIVGGITLYCGWVMSADVARIILLAVCGFSLGGLLPTIMSVPAFLPEVGPVNMGSAGGVISTIMMAGAFLLPSYVVTPIAKGINNVTFIIAAVLAVLLAITFLFLPNVSVKKS